MITSITRLTSIFTGNKHPKDNSLQNISKSFQEGLTKLDNELPAINLNEPTIAQERTDLGKAQQTRNKFIQDYVEAIITGGKNIDKDHALSGLKQNFEELSKQRSFLQTDFSSTQHKALGELFLLIHGANGLDNNGDIDHNIFTQWLGSIITDINSSRTTNISFSLKSIDYSKLSGIKINDTDEISFGREFTRTKISENIKSKHQYVKIITNTLINQNQILIVDKFDEVQLIPVWQYSQQDNKVNFPAHPKLIGQFHLEIQKSIPHLKKQRRNDILSICCNPNDLSRTISTLKSKFELKEREPQQILNLWQKVFQNTNVNTKFELTRSLNKISIGNLENLSTDKNITMDKIMHNGGEHTSLIQRNNDN